MWDLGRWLEPKKGLDDVLSFLSVLMFLIPFFFILALLLFNGPD